MTGELLKSALAGGSIASFDTSPDCGALRLPAVFAGIRAISETVASFPCQTYQRTADGGKQRAIDHAVYPLLHDRPNGNTIPFVFWDTIVRRMITKGNAFCFIERDGGNSPINLILLDNCKVEISVANGEKYYTYDKKYTVAAADMLHFIGFSLDGICGVPLLVYAEQTLALGLAAECYGFKFFTQGSAVGGTIELTGMPTDDQLKLLKSSWETAHQGVGNAHKTAIVPGGKFVPGGATNEASQFIETRKYQTIEICRLLRIPPHIVQDLERATFTNIEAQGREFLQFTVRPWLKRIEQELTTKLFGTIDAGQYFVEFLVDDLLRADTQTRYAAYAVGRNGGWLSANDIRGMENMPPIAGGDEYLSPLNMRPAAEPAPTTGTNNGTV